jgi:PAS domain-containing protein
MKKQSLVILGLAIVVGVIVAFVVDPLDRTTLSTPFCLGLLLLALSIRQAPWVVVTSCVVFCALDIYAMFDFMKHAPHSPIHPLFWFYQRFGLFAVVCLMSIYLSYFRDQMQGTLDQTKEILSKLPAPVVISDAAGYVTYVNDYLCTFLNQPSSQLVGKRYVDLFMTDIQDGKAMRYYIELFADPSPNHEMKLRTSAAPAPLVATVACLGSGAHRNMITVIQPS